MDQAHVNDQLGEAMAPGEEHNLPLSLSTLPGRSKAVAVISQQMLKELLQLKERVRRHDELRTHIVGMLEAGCPIESGGLTAVINRVVHRALNGASLLPLLGPDQVNDLKSRITPVTQKQLIVTSSTTASHAASGPISRDALD